MEQKEVLEDIVGLVQLQIQNKLIERKILLFPITVEEELGHMEWKVGSVGATECALVNIRGSKVKGGRLSDIGKNIPYKEKFFSLCISITRREELFHKAGKEVLETLASACSVTNANSK